MSKQPAKQPGYTAIDRIIAYIMIGCFGVLVFQAFCGLNWMINRL